jgi:triosephosphate isomerase
LLIRRYKIGEKMIIASNFKTNYTRKLTKEFISKTGEYLRTNNKSEVYIFPSATSLDKYKTNKNLYIGSQNAYGIEKTNR